MDSNEGTIGRLVTRLILGNRDGPVIKFEDDGTTEEQRAAFVEELIRNKPIVDRMYRGRHGGGMPMPASLLREHMEYEERSKTLWGRAVNKLYDFLDYFL